MNRINCTRCSIFFQSHAVYAESELTAVSGTRARLCRHCTQKLIASGHIRRCTRCQEYHSRGHRAPSCPFVLPLDRLPVWSYNVAPAGAHGRYVKLWRMAKTARAAEIEGGLVPREFEFGFGNYRTLAAWLRDTRKALNRRINEKAGVLTDSLGRKVMEGTPRCPLGRG